MMSIHVEDRPSRRLVAFLFAFLFLIFPLSGLLGVDVLFHWPRLLLLCLFPLLWPGTLHPVLLRSRPDLVALAACVAWAIISSLWATHPGEVLLGTSSVRNGLFLDLLLAAAYLSASRLPPGVLSRHVFPGLVGVLFVISLLEFLGFRPLWLFHLGIETSYPAATIDQRGWIGGLMALMVMQAALMAYASLLEGRLRLVVAWPALATLVMASSVLAMTSNTSAGIGVVVCLLGLCAWSAWRGRQSTLPGWQRAPGGVGALAAALMCCFAFGAGLLSRPMLVDASSLLAWHGLVEAEPQVKDPADLHSFHSRLTLWNGAFKQVAERPWLGWGPAAYPLVWHLGLPPADWLELAGLETGADRGPGDVVPASGRQHWSRIDGVWQLFDTAYQAPHNAALQVAFEFGWPGLLLLFAFLLLSARRICALHGPLALLPFAAYAAYLLAWFTMPVVTGYAAIMLGLAAPPKEGWRAPEVAAPHPEGEGQAEQAWPPEVVTVSRLRSGRPCSRRSP